MMPEVTVVVPTRDRRDLVRMTLLSILRQRDVEFEVMVIDDGSRDGTSDIVRAMRDPRLRLVRHEDSRGVSASRNRGIAESRGRWIAFCDDDDLWAPDKLRRQLEELEATKRDWAYTGVVRIDAQHRLLGGAPPSPPDVVVADLERVNSVDAGPSTVVVTSDRLDEVGGFDRALVPAEDWDMWLRLAETGLPACCPEPLVAYREHAHNVSLDVERMTVAVRRFEARWGRIDRTAYHLWLADLLWDRGRTRPALRQFLLAATSSRSRASLGAVGGWMWGRVGRAKRSDHEADPYLAAAEAWLEEFLADVASDQERCGW